jgi:hypothetical protein
MIDRTECPDCGVVAQECEKGHLKKAYERVSPVLVSFRDCYKKPQRIHLLFPSRAGQ